MRFVGPSDAAGKDVFETENLRVRVELPEDSSDCRAPLKPLIASIVVENKRSIMAYLDSRRCCLIDPESGAFNLFRTNRIIPPKSWVRVNRVWPVDVIVNFNWVLGPYYADAAELQSVAEDVPAAGATQRVLLTVVWDDEKTEAADLPFEITGKEAAAEQTADTCDRGPET